MKNLQYKIFTAAVLIIFFSVSIALYGDPDGRTGRTLKTSTSGCGGCHGSSAVTDVEVLLNGPDTVTAGQTRLFTLTISKPSKTGAGLDIATRRGTLTPVSANIHLSNGELTQNNNIPMTAGSVTVQFNYTAPATPVTDTLWTTGLATNSNGGTSGDDWNWAASKRIIVKLATGIAGNNSVVSNFRLDQNFPNPFNPITEISYELASPEFVSMKVFSTNGIEVTTLVNERKSAGIYYVNFNGSDLSSGIYFYTITAGEFRDTRRMMMIK